MRTSYFVLFFLLTGFSIPAGAQPGCTDPLATNYNPAAQSNDGSCVYAATSYALNALTALDPLVKESSGLVMADGALWTHNDGGNAPVIYQIDTLTNAVLKKVTLNGVTNEDWEDLAFDGTYFYVGDFGNNANGNRTDLVIYKFPLSAIPAGDDVSLSASDVAYIGFAYEDQTDFSPQGSNNTRFDCEAMIWQNDSLHLFTKDWIGGQSVHYVLPATEGQYLARRVESFPANGLITGADVSGTGVIVLSGYRTDNYSLFAWLLFDYPARRFFDGNKRRIELGSAAFSGQTEGVCLRNNGYGYISNEALNATVLGIPVMVPARLYRFSIAQWLPAGLLSSTGDVLNQSDCRVWPNPVRAGAPIRLKTDFACDSISVLSAQTGQLVWKGPLTLWKPELPTAGSYFLHFSDAAGTQRCAVRVVAF